MSSRLTFHSSFAAGAVAALAGLMASGALAGTDLTTGRILDTPGKHIMASNVIGAAAGLEERNALPVTLRARVAAVEAETIPELRQALAPLEAAGRRQALDGTWDSFALEAWLEALEAPGAGYARLAGKATEAGWLDYDLIAEGVADGFRGRRITEQDLRAATEIALLDARVMLGGRGPVFGVMLEAGRETEIDGRGPLEPAAAGTLPSTFLLADREGPDF
ncbi:hypothetical protein LAZ40_11730 [Cereibacter sphaeroides]|uniref:hypothetical protein n=1 Tax=Cereibacter sphaeroides TaxID=1063 RepID=UPI001F299482|nr:hypothetical protein [Cereibacter sphaeroides]MCE6959689.1 hypothetical protein [Cereibacter sphaeroides]MCE6974450.1 hypothetical protein [Cereibacter sphaeroides]